MIRKIVYGLFILLGVGLLFFYFFQERFIFLNGKKLPKDFVYDFPQRFTEVNLQTTDNEEINALHFTLDQPKGVILFFHGNKGNLNRWGKIVPYLLDYGYEVFVMDYRNYGKSSGKFDEERMYSDAVLAFDYLLKSFNQDQIVVYGRSLGAAFASEVGVKRNPKHIILEAPFYNMKKATRFYFSLSPIFLLKYKFENNVKVSQINSPITFFHGDADETTSYDQSKELFQLVKTAKREFVEIPSGTHHDLKEFDVYRKALAKILE